MYKVQKLEGSRVAFIITDEDHSAVAGGQCLRELLIRFSEKTDGLIDVQHRCSKNCTEDCAWVTHQLNWWLEVGELKGETMEELNRIIALTHRVLVGSSIKLYFRGEKELGEQFKKHDVALHEIEDVDDVELKLRLLHEWAKSLIPLMDKGAKALGYDLGCHKTQLHSNGGESSDQIITGYS